MFTPFGSAVFISSVCTIAGEMAVVLRLEEQCREPGDVGRGHRGAADRVVATELLMGPGRVDLAAGPAEVRLQAELGVGAEGAEVGDEARGRERSLENLVRPDERVIRRELLKIARSVSLRDRSDRNVDRGRPGGTGATVGLSAPAALL